jgi:phosphoglycolate phosphatase-like HAD superfamily hydrolase
LLLTHDEVYVEAARITMQEVFGDVPDGPDVPGDTASAHVRRALEAAGAEPATIEAGLPRWCELFSARYVELLARADTSHWQLAPHATDAVAGLERHALLTGNPPAVAHARMDRLGIGALFERGQGAYGCERERRVDLFQLARERAGGWPAERTVAVGDTPLDVSSSHIAGCRCVGVTTGSYGEDELRDADAVIGDLSELGDALAALRLNGPAQ